MVRHTPGPSWRFELLLGTCTGPAGRGGRSRTSPDPSLDPQRRIAAFRALMIAHYGDGVVATRGATVA